ncbi:MAG: methyltransferase domain-containing protein [bacterium]|nr:methyltransferase domain-containing protein [bacterium]
MNPTAKPASSPRSWWREWFNDIYLDVYAHRDDASARIEAQRAVETLGLQPGDRILDLCCGAGRHCRALRRAGFNNVFGLDFSHPLLRFALHEKPRADYMRGDMRLLPLRGESIDAVTSFFTSFGYFKTNVENLRVLQEIGRVLVSGGRFFIDYLNPDYVRDHFEPHSARRHGEYEISETRRFSEDGERIEKEIVIRNWGGEERRFCESVRLYSLAEIETMLDGAGLAAERVFGDFDASPPARERPRTIVSGRKQG